MADYLGFEPRTYRLTAERSTAELIVREMEGIDGLEPSIGDSKSPALTNLAISLF